MFISERVWYNITIVPTHRGQAYCPLYTGSDRDRAFLVKQAGLDELPKMKERILYETE